LFVLDSETERVGLVNKRLPGQRYTYPVHPVLKYLSLSTRIAPLLCFFKHSGDTPWPKARFTNIQERTTEERQKGTELGRSTSNVS